MKKTVELVEDHPTLWFDDLLIEYLERVAYDDSVYIQDRMDIYMDEKRNDIDEMIEIDDMRVCNDQLFDIIERIKALHKKDEWLVYVPAAVEFEDDE